LTNITPEELYKKMQQNHKVTIIDVRAEEKYQDFHIADSRNIPKSIIFELNDAEGLSLPKSEVVVITCTTGNSAAKCAHILSEHGYRTTVLEGGLTAWKTYLQTIEGAKNE
jgi:rhodanese-related sulfurtransferase